jgi:hypothetical protein
MLGSSGGSSSAADNRTSFDALTSLFPVEWFILLAKLEGEEEEEVAILVVWIDEFTKCKPLFF